MTTCRIPSCEHEALGADYAEFSVADLCEEHALPVMRRWTPPEPVAEVPQTRLGAGYEMAVERAGAGERPVKFTDGPTGRREVWRTGHPDVRSPEEDPLDALRWLRDVQVDHDAHLLDQRDLAIVEAADCLGLNSQGQIRSRLVARELGVDGRTVWRRIKKMQELAPELRDALESNEPPQTLEAGQAQWDRLARVLTLRRLVRKAAETGRPLRVLIREHNIAVAEGREKHEPIPPEDLRQFWEIQRKRAGRSREVTRNVTWGIERKVDPETRELTDELVLTGAVPRLEKVSVRGVGADPGFSESIDLREWIKAGVFADVDTDPPRCTGCGRRIKQPATGRPRKFHDEACRSRWRRLRKEKQP